MFQFILSLSQIRHYADRCLRTSVQKNFLIGLNATQCLLRGNVMDIGIHFF